MQHQCPICGKEFKLPLWQSIKYPTHFCSRKCLFQSMRNGIKVACHQCGRSHYRPPNKIQNRQHAFCCCQCKIKYREKRREELFWKCVKKTDTCWIWTGAKSKGGYGKFSNMRAHRYSWKLHFGPIPKGKCVCHDCEGGDNPSCVRPDHLWLGTNGENTRDAMNKGRMAFGERHGCAKLNQAQVNEIKSHKGGPRGIQRNLARKFGVSDTTISDIMLGKIWI